MKMDHIIRFDQVHPQFRLKVSKHTMHTENTTVCSVDVTREKEFYYMKTLETYINFRCIYSLFLQFNIIIHKICQII